MILKEGLPDAKLYVVHIADGHFEDIVHFLTTGTMPHRYYVQQKKELAIHATDFTVISDHLYKMGNDKILWRYVLEFEHR